MSHGSKIGLVFSALVSITAVTLAAEDTWTKKTDMPTARWGLSTSVVNGKIYAIGGMKDASSAPLSTVEEYDPATDTWTRKANMPTPRVSHSTSAVNGKIYAIGGGQSVMGAGRSTVEEYDPETDTWMAKADMPTARLGLSTSVVNGKVYAIGGLVTLGGSALSTVQEYDLATDTWITKADAPTARFWLSTSMVNRKVYVIGGSVAPWPSWQACSTVEEYDTGLIVTPPPPDFNGDRIVDFKDYAHLARYWQQNESSVDIAPPPFGDGIVDLRDLAVLTEHWLEEYQEIVYIQWLAHASVKIWTADEVIYVDPRNLSGSPHDATLVLVTHSHSDHYSPADISKVSGPETKLIASADVIASEGRGQALMPGQTTEADGVRVIGVAAYNINKPNHPKANNWLGFIIEIASKRIYCAGDTDLIPEMQTLGNIDVAFLPAGGTYTMDATEAAQAATIINPTLAIPYHWGTSVGTLADAELFVRLAACNAKVMSAGETISSEDWSKDFSLIAHWRLDETEGNIAHDSVASNDGALNGNPIWQPSDGQIDGALQLDGSDDYVSTPFVLNPADGAFSVFVWIKGGAPEQVVISQTGGMNWLSADPSEGNLMTELKEPGRFGRALISQTVITDGDWHRVGLVWDGSNRILYVDDVQVAMDTQSSLAGSEGGLYFGAAKGLEPGSFWSGLIDDVRIHSAALRTSSMTGR